MNLNARRRPRQRLTLGINNELTSDQATRHEDPRAQPIQQQPLGAQLAGEREHPRRDALRLIAGALIDSREQGIGGMGEHSGRGTSHDAGTELDGRRAPLRQLGLPLRSQHAVDALDSRLMNGELPHRVRDLLSDERDEPGIEAPEALLPREAREPGRQAGRVPALRDEADARGLEGAQGDVGQELGRGAGAQVDGGAAAGGDLGRPGRLDQLLLEELVPRELAAPLHQVADGRGAEPGQEGRRAFLGDDLPPRAHHVEPLHGVVDLDARFDYVDGSCGLFSPPVSERGRGSLGEISGWGIYAVSEGCREGTRAEELDIVAPAEIRGDARGSHGCRTSNGVGI